ncbi:MAG: hypothetical protein ABFD08_20055 [Syntrophomonas sp.]
MEDFQFLKGHTLSQLKDIGSSSANTLKRLFTLGFIMGMVYFTLEGFWRGWTHIAMLFIGGSCAVLIGLLNEQPEYYGLKIWQQSFIGMLVVLLVEFMSGMILNVWLGWGLWDYSELPGNLYGQICLPYSIMWFFLIPAAICLDDWLRWKLYQEGQAISLGEIYLRLITLK